LSIGTVEDEFKSAVDQLDVVIGETRTAIVTLRSVSDLGALLAP
jgi:hypothetical protein